MVTPSPKTVKELLKGLMDGSRQPSSDQELKAFLGMVVDCIEGMEKHAEHMSKMATPADFTIEQLRIERERSRFYRKALKLIGRRICLNRRRVALNALRMGK